MNPDSCRLTGKCQQRNLQLEALVDHQGVIVVGDGLGTVCEGEHLLATVDLPEAHSHELAFHLSQLLGHAQQIRDGFPCLLGGVSQPKDIHHVTSLEEVLPMLGEFMGKLLVKLVHLDECSTVRSELGGSVHIYLQDVKKPSEEGRGSAGGQITWRL